MGMFKSRKEPPRPAQGGGRTSNFREPSIPGTHPGPPFLKTPFIASTKGPGSIDSIAHYVGFGQSIHRNFSSADCASDHIFVVDATRDLEFALGFSDEPRRALFTSQTGDPLMLVIDWTPPIGRSQVEVGERLRETFGVSETPIATIHGILTAGMSIWTLALTASSLYALGESGQPSIQVPLADIFGLRLSGFELALNYAGHDQNYGLPQPGMKLQYESLAFFHVRYITTWTEFATAVEEAWIKVSIAEPANKVFGDLGSLSVYSRSHYGNLFTSHFPFREEGLRQTASSKGLQSVIESWAQQELEAFRLRTQK